MIHTVNLDMTTHCDRRCPDCCAGIGINRTLQHHPWEYFVEASRVLYGIDRVNLTGGEPTAHPRFGQFVSHFRDLFGCTLLTLSTNGYRVREYVCLIETEFDYVHYSTYGDNLGPLQLLRDAGIKVSVFDGGEQASNFVKLDKRGTGDCFRASRRSGTIAYADGMLFGCCVAPGIDQGAGTRPHMDWREWIERAPLPCDQCLFSEER